MTENIAAVSTNEATAPRRSSRIITIGVAGAALALVAACGSQPKAGFGTPKQMEQAAEAVSAGYSCTLLSIQNSGNPETMTVSLTRKPAATAAAEAYTPIHALVASKPEVFAMPRAAMLTLRGVQVLGDDTQYARAGALKLAVGQQPELSDPVITSANALADASGTVTIPLTGSHKGIVGKTYDVYVHQQASSIAGVGKLNHSAILQEGNQYNVESFTNCGSIAMTGDNNWKVVTDAKPVHIDPLLIPDFNAPDAYPN